jgi:hypothetical protein
MLFVVSFPIILDVYCLDYYQLKGGKSSKKKESEKRKERKFASKHGLLLTWKVLW